MYQSTYAERLKKSGTTINYHITKFQQEGLIDNNLKLTSKGMRLFKYVWENSDKIILRAHNVMVKFNVTSCPINYIDLYSTSVFTTFGNGRYRGIKGRLEDCTFMLYSRHKIICVLPDIFASDDEEVSAQIQLLITRLKERIELELPGINLGDYELAKIISSHIALFNSVLAQKIILKRLEYKGDTLVVDNSNHTPETELVDPESNLDTIEDLVKLESKLRKKKIGRNDANSK
jgi:hypothetical protein